MSVKLGDKVKFIGRSYFIKHGSIGVIVELNPPLAQFAGGVSTLFEPVEEAV